MLQPQGQAQPMVNSLPVGVGGSLKVTAIPSFVTQNDFSQLFMSMEGCISAQLAGRQGRGEGEAPAVAAGSA